MMANQRWLKRNELPCGKNAHWPNHNQPLVHMCCVRRESAPQLKAVTTPKMTLAFLHKCGSDINNLGPGQMA